MKNLFPKIWSYFNGKKTLIGLLLAVVYSGLVAQGIIERNSNIEWVILAVTGVGISHKIAKN